MHPLLAFFSSPLFHTVQMSGIFADSKTFADALPKTSWSDIEGAFEALSPRSNEDIRSFVTQYFEMPDSLDLSSDIQAQNIAEYIDLLWHKLQKPADTERATSLLPLSYPYVVPGGRFREIYYWDSYFTALGLIDAGKHDLVRAMVDNFIDLQQRVGCIPNGNRIYYQTRSQPPVLALMIELLLKSDKRLLTDTAQIKYFVDGLISEYEFWLSGVESLSSSNPAHRRVVRMPNGEVLNRFWDDSAEPRPESYREDVEAANELSAEQRIEFYRNIRAACESGWDFSSRWFGDPEELTSIRTTSIVPVDLNCLLFKTETLLAELLNTIGKSERANIYADLANSRQTAIQRHMWSERNNAFFDYDIEAKAQTETLSLATVLPLFVGLATNAQASAVASLVEQEFLKPGGLVTTLTTSEHQWDSPNGWAPLHWFAVIGLRKYGHNNLADEIAKRWLSTVEHQFNNHGQLMEKYNVVAQEQIATGGEYEVQHGFGWTNGVTLALAKLQYVDRLY